MLAKIRFDTMTNRETWLGRVEIRNGVTGEPLDLSEADIQLEVSNRTYKTTVLKASSDNGLIKGSVDGIIEWEFPEGAMRQVSSGFYKVGLVYTLNEHTTQVLIGDIHIEDGGIS